jgi:hypothetical protein
MFDLLSTIGITVSETVAVAAFVGLFGSSLTQRILIGDHLAMGSHEHADRFRVVLIWITYQPMAMADEANSPILLVRYWLFCVHGLRSCA